MKYRVLPSSLYDTADAAISFFREEFGWTGFDIEEPIDEDVAFRPTLSVETREHDIVCVEVSDTAYPNTLDQFVLACKNRGLPVRLYVATPKGAEDPSYKINTARARTSGVGIVEVDSRGGHLVYEALSLSLTGYRKIDKGAFPARYRPALVSAEHTFSTGSPVKGCAIIYDEIERLTRSAAKKALARGAWTKATPSGHVPSMNLDTESWANVLTTMSRHCDFSKCGCPQFTADLLTRALGIVPFRNESGHKPRRVADRIRRDTQLRTRFEMAADLLQDLVTASKALRL